MWLDWGFSARGLRFVMGPLVVVRECLQTSPGSSASTREWLAKQPRVGLRATRGCSQNYLGRFARTRDACDQPPEAINVQCGTRNWLQDAVCNSAVYSIRRAGYSPTGHIRQPTQNNIFVSQAKGLGCLKSPSSVPHRRMQQRRLQQRRLQQRRPQATAGRVPTYGVHLST